MGARVTVYDPAALDNARRARPELSYAPTLAAAAQGAHARALLLTEWPEFTALTPDRLGRHRGQAQHDRRPQRLTRSWQAGRRWAGVRKDTAARARLDASP